MAYDIPYQATISPAVRMSVPSTRREHGVTVTGEPIFRSVRGDAVEEVTALWDKLSANATIIEPFAPRSGRRPSACLPTASASPGSWTLQ